MITDKISISFPILQDGAQPHTAKKVMEELSGIFGRKIMSDKGPKYGGKDWSPCSHDLSPLDFLEAIMTAFLGLSITSVV